MKRPEGFDAPAPVPRPDQRKVRRQPVERETPAPAARIRPLRPEAQGPEAQPPQAKSPGARPPRTNAASSGLPAARIRSEIRSARRAERSEARRFTRGSRRRRATWLTIIGLVVVLALVLVVAVFSPLLALRTIQVDGVTAIPASTIQSALKSQLGTPLALLDDGAIRERLSRIILIRSYTTEIVPPHTLVVRIVERQAIAVLPHGAKYDEVDPAGVVLRTSPTADGLPVIDIGKSGVDSAGFAAAVKVLLAMPSSVLGQVKSISATTLDNVSLTLDSGTHTVLWGSSSQSDLKATALATLLKTCAAQPVLNVTAPLALACGPNQPTPTSTPTVAPTSTPAP